MFTGSAVSDTGAVKKSILVGSERMSELKVDTGASMSPVTIPSML